MLSTLIRTATSSRIRTRAAGLTAGLCASAVLAGGAAMAADGTQSGTAESFGSGTAAELSQATRGQADLQEQAAKAAEVGKEKSAKKSGEKAEKEKKAEKKAAAPSWVSPIDGDSPLSAPYGNSGERWASSHSGQDFAVSTGTSVQAVHGGTVVKAGGNGAGDGPAYGNAVVVKHTDGTFSQYAHLEQVNVSAGDSVKTGEKIAVSGNTGNSSGPHLHFEIRTSPDFGTAVDPMEFLRDQGAEV